MYNWQEYFSEQLKFQTVVRNGEYLSDDDDELQ